MKTLILLALLAAGSVSAQDVKNVDLFSHTKELDSFRLRLKYHYPIGVYTACSVNHLDGVQCQWIDGQWQHHYKPNVDSTWCPVYEHIFECRFKTRPWSRKHGSYYRVRICKFHKVKQIQRAK
jgi:hypothetical protein